MTRRNPVMCPACGWTGHATDLDDTAAGSACPTCGESVGAVPE
ncbi:hypothetical protein [Halobacterium bonnevillei]|nr:hypothetical protein [Halobacterium bonnevillei]